MIRPGSTRTAFPTETRRVPGTDNCYKSHILAYCRSCGAEGAILIPNNAGSVPPEAGVKMFRKRLHWKMGPHRNKDLCPTCAARGKIGAAPKDQRRGLIETLQEDLEKRLALDPAYTEQKEYDALYKDFPLLALIMVEIEAEYAAEGRTLPPNLKQRGEVLLQAAMKRAKRDNLLDEEMIAEIEDRIDDLNDLMQEVEDRAAILIPLMEQVNAADMPAPKPKAPEVPDMTPHTAQSGRPGTALGDAFIKAQTDKIKQEAAQRPERTPQEQAALDKLIADQKRDATRGVKLTGKNRPAPLPPSKPAPAFKVVTPAEVTTAEAFHDRKAQEDATAEPPTRKAPNRVKRTGGWDDMTPEQHAARAAKMTLKRNERLAEKAGLSFEEWSRRNEARKAQEAQRREAKANKAAGGRRDVPRHVQDDLDAKAMLNEVIRIAGAAGAALSRGDIAILTRKTHEAIDAYRERLAAHSLRYQSELLAPPAPLAPKPQPETPMPATPAPQAIHDNTVNPTAAGVLDRLKISEALNEHYVRATSNGEGGYYKENFSDQSLADLLGVPAAWIEERREAMLFGPDVNEHTSKDAEEIEALMQEIKDLKAAQERLFDAGAAEVSDIEARQAALLERIKADTQDLLSAAAEKVAAEVARMEDRVIDIEQRLRAVAERR